MQLPDAIRDRDVQLLDGARSELAVRVEAMAALKAFDPFDQRAAVDVGVGGRRRIGREVAQQDEALAKRRRAGVLLTGFDGLRRDG